MATPMGSPHQEVPPSFRAPYMSGDAILDLSYLDLDTETLDSNLEALGNGGRSPRIVELHHNRLATFPRTLRLFLNIHTLNLSNNSLKSLSDDVLRIAGLKILLVRGNLLDVDSLPKDMGALTSLEVLNISGNQFAALPPQIFELSSLRELYVGGNRLEVVPKDIGKLAKLESLYLGGNALREIPAEVGKLQNLRSLVLSQNKLVTLPSSLSCLRKLRSLAIHDNLLTTLPPCIVRLENLIELSLRGNPLVVRFVRDMTYDPPSLQELAARCVKIQRILFSREDVPQSLLSYLDSAQCCVNPKCKGTIHQHCWWDVITVITMIAIVTMSHTLDKPSCTVTLSWNAVKFGNRAQLLVLPSQITCQSLCFNMLMFRGKVPSTRDTPLSNRKYGKVEVVPVKSTPEHRFRNAGRNDRL